jgi:hypothetical protein
MSFLGYAPLTPELHHYLGFVSDRFSDCPVDDRLWTIIGMGVYPFPESLERDWEIRRALDLVTQERSVAAALAQAGLFSSSGEARRFNPKFAYRFSDDEWGVYEVRCPRGVNWIPKRFAILIVGVA